MKAWVLEDIGKFSYKEIKDPKPDKDEALVRVRNCGICGSDIPRVYKDGAHVMPLVIGHEFSGEVVSTGDDCDRNLRGKRVGIYPLIPCMRCSQCLEGHYEMCRSYGYLGSRRDGGFAEYTAVPVWNLIELPDNVSFEQAAMLEPMAVAAHALRSLSVSKGDTIAVYGQGTIGLFITMLLLAEGHTDVFVFANHELQIEKALQLGISVDNICDIRNSDPLKWAFERTFGRGFDSSFEAVGSSVTCEQAIALAAPGGRICLMGNPQTDMGFKRDIYWKILRNQLTVRGIWNSDHDEDWQYILKLLEEGRIAPERLISHKYPMKELEQGFLIMRDKTEDYIKIMMENNSA